jgi:hypothetical protein
MQHTYVNNNRRKCTNCTSDRCVTWTQLIMLISLICILIGLFSYGMSEQKRIMDEYSPANTIDKIEYVCGQATYYRGFYTCTENPCCQWISTNNQTEFGICTPKNMTSYETCPCGGVCLQAEMYYELGIYLMIIFSFFLTIIAIIGACYANRKYRLSRKCRFMILKWRWRNYSTENNSLLPVN